MPISLIKGENVDFQKDNGIKIDTICIGINWGAIDKQGFFGPKKVNVDLDATVVTFDKNNNMIEIVYYSNLKSHDGAIIHSGDDKTGDKHGNDGLDNEIISVDFNKLDEKTDKIVIILNSYKGQDFSTIPFATMRVYEGQPNKPEKIHFSYNVSGDPKFAEYVSMIMGKIYRLNSGWKIQAIGEPTKDKTIKTTIRTIIEKYL